MHCIKSQRQVWTWCRCCLSRRFTQSKLDSCFFLCATLGRLGFCRFFGPHWHERLESLSRWKPGWPSWHFTKQIRQEVFSICNDIADPSCICLRQTTFCTCSVSTQQHGRSVHTIICQCKPGHPSITLEHKAYTKHFPVLLWSTTKIAESTIPKVQKSADKALSQPRCNHSYTIYDVQLQKRVVSITHAAAVPSNLDAATTHYNAICRHWIANHYRTARNSIGNCSSKTGSRRQSRKKTILKHFLKEFLKGKLLAPKWRKSADNSLSQPWCSHSNTIYDLQLQKTIVLRMQPQHQATLTQPFQCDLQLLSCKTQ